MPEFQTILQILCLDLLPSCGDIGTDLSNGLHMLGVNSTGLSISTITDDSTYRKDNIWGGLTIFLIFLPGIPYAISILMEDIKNPQKWLFAMLAMIGYPFFNLIVQCAAIYSCNKEALDNVVLAVSYEAFYQSSPQIVLQLFTIQYGYEVTVTQILTILFSFFVAVKSAIFLDLKFSKTLFIDWKDRLTHFAYAIFVFSTGIIFRIACLSITTAYLRYYSIPYYFIRPIIYVILAHFVIKYDKEETRFVALSNLGSMTRGKDVPDTDDVDAKDSSKFLVISTVSTFVWETFCLLCILIMTNVNPTLFSHWETELIYFNSTPTIISSLIFVGLINLLLIYIDQKWQQISWISQPTSVPDPQTAPDV